MSGGLRKGFVGVLLLTLAGWVYAPILECGPLGPDYEVLAGASELAFPESAAEGEASWRRWFEAPGTDGRPLAALSLAASARLWTSGGVWGRVELHVLRLENLALLLASAFFVGRFVLRLLVPWTGSDQARAAGLASTVLLVVHPLSVASVAAPDARSALLGALFGSAAALAFLRGRQERRGGWVFAAAALTVTCALASEIAFLVPPLLALTEYVSAHRYRPHRMRLRTTLTTLIAFGACVSLDLLARGAFGLEVAPRGIARSVSGYAGIQPAFDSLLVAFERLGFAIMPVNAAGRGATGFILGVALMLVALQPALRAARSAPRLWAGVLGSWALLMLAAVLFRSDVRVHPRDLGASETLLPAAIVMAAGLGIAATALTGRRRFVVPALALVGASILARSDARCIQEAAEEGELLIADLERTRRELGAARILVLDPPRLVSGHPAVPARMERMLGRALGTTDAAAGALWVRGIDARGLRALLREPGLLLADDELLAVLLRRSLVEEVPGTRREPRFHAVLRPGRAITGPRVWREEGRSPALDLSPASVAALRAVARPGTRTGAPPIASWEAASALFPSGSVEGTWLHGEDGPVALFDLGRSFRWLLGERVRRIWFEGELAFLVQAQVLESLPELRGVSGPVVRGTDWVFVLDWDALPRPRQGDPRFVLDLFDRDGFEHLELEGRRHADELVFPGAERFAAAGRWREGGALSWALEERVGDSAVARSLGR